MAFKKKSTAFLSSVVTIVVLSALLRETAADYHVSHSTISVINNDPSTLLNPSKDHLRSEYARALAEEEDFGAELDRELQSMICHSGDGKFRRRELQSCCLEQNDGKLRGRELRYRCWGEYGEQYYCWPKDEGKKLRHRELFSRELCTGMNGGGGRDPGAASPSGGMGISGGAGADGLAGGSLSDGLSEGIDRAIDGRDVGKEVGQNIGGLVGPETAEDFGEAGGLIGGRIDDSLGPLDSEGNARGGGSDGPVSGSPSGAAANENAAMGDVGGFGAGEGEGGDSDGGVCCIM